MTAHKSVGKIDDTHWGDCAVCGFAWPCSSARPRGSESFHALLKEMGELHDRKQEDYGTDGDPFANVRGATE